VQLSDMCRVLEVDEPRWLCTVHSLIEGAIEEGILHVELMNRPGVGDGNAEDGLNHCQFDNQTEHFIIVDVGLLGVATGDPTSLVARQGAVRVELVLEDPLVEDEVGGAGRGMRFHILFTTRALYSSCMAASQFGSSRAAR
jgi:hypothetical protein